MIVKPYRTVQKFLKRVLLQDTELIYLINCTSGVCPKLSGMKRQEKGVLWLEFETLVNRRYGYPLMYKLELIIEPIGTYIYKWICSKEESPKNKVADILHDLSNFWKSLLSS